MTLSLNINVALKWARNIGIISDKLNQGEKRELRRYLLSEPDLDVASDILQWSKLSEMCLIFANAIQKNNVSTTHMELNSNIIRGWHNFVLCLVGKKVWLFSCSFPKFVSKYEFCHNWSTQIAQCVKHQRPNAHILGAFARHFAFNPWKGKAICKWRNVR